ncbi:MAG: pentapeptide repeat-containing protein [Phormidium tanganyikae FI6-MK23]|jgi:uncharacterized protein YjbI with pentapeptide repeats|nr:pentapeptide repeat-containing protein [Phormidium tanganyikae FI6-MK23]
MPNRKLWKLSSWIIPILTLAAVGGIVAFPPKWEWLGVGENQEISQVTTETIDPQSKQKTVTTIKHEQAKNLWDWFSLLGVPISVAFLGWWLQYLQQKRIEDQAKYEKEIAEEKAKNEKEIAEENQREEVLQAYFDRISALLIDKNVLAISTNLNGGTGFEDGRRSEEKELLDAAAAVVRTRTLSILRRLENDPVRKGSVLLFLSEAEVIRKLNVNLEGANLEGANLGGANLEGAKLIGAKLQGASLIATKLSSINLRFANLKDARLKNANLEGADLRWANLEGAILEGADLRWANLEGAILEGAKLEGAKNITPNQIQQAADYDWDFREKLELP